MCYNAKQGTLQLCDMRPPEHGARRTHRGKALDAFVIADDYHSRFWGYGFSYARAPRAAEHSFGHDAPV